MPGTDRPDSESCGDSGDIGYLLLSMGEGWCSLQTTGDMLRFGLGQRLMDANNLIYQQEC